MNFSYGVIAAVGILVAAILGMIAMDPGYLAEPSATDKEKICTMEWAPVCGIDGNTYGNKCMLDAKGVELDYVGECMLSETKESESSMPMSATVTIAEGSGTPGCEETNECFLPYETTIAVGGTVTWENIDSAAHTVTSGSMDDGPDGLFDSGLFMSGESFQFTFDESGEYDYFCMVHPWMTGKVTVI